MKPPVTLMPDSLSTDTVELCRTLLEHAESGNIVGIAFAAQLKQRKYIVNTAGECHRNPTWTRGMVAALDDELGRRIKGRE